MRARILHLPIVLGIFLIFVGWISIAQTPPATSSRDLSLTVAVGNDAGSLAGIAKDSKGVKVPLGVVVLIPDEPNANLRIATATTNSSGAFKLQAAPGAYHLYAWHELIGAPYLNPEFMMKIAEKGIPVRISANGRATMDATAQ